MPRGRPHASSLRKVESIWRLWARRAWHLPGRWPDRGRSTVARWTRRREPDLTLWQGESRLTRADEIFGTFYIHVASTQFTWACVHVAGGMYMTDRWCNNENQSEHLLLDYFFVHYSFPFFRRSSLGSINAHTYGVTFAAEAFCLRIRKVLDHRKTALNLTYQSTFAPHFGTF